MGYTVQGKCTSAVTPAVQCMPGRVHCVQVQDFLRLWAGGQREEKRSAFIIHRFKFNVFFFPFQKKKKKKEHYVLINPRGRQLTLVEQGLT